MQRVQELEKKSKEDDEIIGDRPATLERTRNDFNIMPLAKQQTFVGEYIVQSAKTIIGMMADIQVRQTFRLALHPLITH